MQLPVLLSLSLDGFVQLVSKEEVGLTKCEANIALGKPVREEGTGSPLLRNYSSWGCLGKSREDPPGTQKLGAGNGVFTRRNFLLGENRKRHRAARRKSCEGKKAGEEMRASCHTTEITSEIRGTPRSKQRRTGGK